MKEQLISFSTAKLAKEKGFDNYDVANYYREGINYALNNSGTSTIKEVGNYPAPTQSLLQKWLREKH